MREYDFSDGVTYFNGEWLPGDTPLISGMSSGGWVASTAFDGLRGIHGTIPDSDLHCQRLIASSRGLGHAPDLGWQQVLELCWQGLERFATDSDLYIRPMFWADSGFIAPDADSTRFALTVFEMPMPLREDTMTAAISSYARPLPNTAPTHVKAAGLYPNSGLAILEARKRGFKNALLKDTMGNIAEFSASNLMIVKNGEVITPSDNGFFLCGITRLRSMELLRQLGIPVREGRVSEANLRDADEVLSMGNYAKVMAVSQIEDIHYSIGPVFHALYDAYQAYARDFGQRPNALLRQSA